MAKSLRAKTKVRFRGVKRQTIWGDADKARTLRLAEKLHGKPAEQILQEQAEKALERDADKDVEMHDNSEPKVSTSGWKGSRNDSYKKSKAAKRAKASLVFRRGSMKSRK